jgi:hypothetical protein
MGNVYMSISRLSHVSRHDIHTSSRANFPTSSCGMTQLPYAADTYSNNRYLTVQLSSTTEFSVLPSSH